MYLRKSFDKAVCGPVYFNLTVLSEKQNAESPLLCDIGQVIVSKACSE
jgi:hypothetical protein